MSERQLAVLVQRFERLASDVVTTHGGRVIKTVGDEVLFIHTDPAAAAAIALDLVEAMSEDDVLPEVRVGMAWGSVVSRLGDVFGVTVDVERDSAGGCFIRYRRPDPRPARLKLVADRRKPA